MGMMTQLKAKWDEARAIPTCGDCGQAKEHYISGAYICRPCVARKTFDEWEVRAAAEARQFSQAVVASPEYKALRDRLTVLEIAVGAGYTDGEGGAPKVGE